MKRNIPLLLCLLMIGMLGYSQQEAQFSQNMFNQMAINPGYAGSNDAICATALARQQWVGFKQTDADGAESGAGPQTYLISLHAPLEFLHGGLGLTVFQDQLGFEKNLGVKLAYAYRFNLGEGKMGVGLQAGFLNKTIDFSKFKPIEANDPTLTDKSSQKSMFTDFGLGVYYQIPGKLYAGLSSSQLLQNKQTIGSTEFELKRHLYITAGYEYVIPSFPSLEIDPSFFIKTDLTSTQYDINALFKYNSRFWAGFSYRVQDAVAILLGMNFKNFHIGYSYDITTSALGPAGSSGSHEILVGYCFKIEIEKKRTSNKNTRFL